MKEYIVKGNSTDFDHMLKTGTIIRCKDCDWCEDLKGENPYCHKLWRHCYPEGYCAWGENDD